MVDAVSSTTLAADGAAAMKKATGMNKDDFLKLFVTQLQNQDPMKPQDSNQFIAQLAQLSQVEQSYNTNTNLQSLLTAQNNATVVSAVSFIGKDVLAAGSQVSLTAGSSIPHGIGGSSTRGDESRRKRLELRCEYEGIRPRSERRPASKKSPKYVKHKLPVPETDTGGMVENTKGREITLSKELGKMAP